MMLRVEDLARYSDADLLGLIQKLDILSTGLGAGPMANGPRWKQLCQAELQRRRHLKRPLRARVEEVR